MKKIIVVLCASLVCAMNVFAQAASDSKTVDCNGSVTIKATPVSGYHFVKWVDAASNEYTDAEMTVSSIKEAKTFTAHFAANDPIDPSIVDPDNPTPNPGDVIQLTPHPADDCQEFWHWSDIAEDDTTNPLYNVSPRPFTYTGEAPTFTAVFRTKTYNVNVNTATGDETQGSVEFVTVP